MNRDKLTIQSKTKSQGDLIPTDLVRAERKKSPALDHMGQMMDDPDFRKFFRKYFDNWSDLKTTVMFLHTYLLIEESYYRKTGVKLNSDQVVYLLKQTILHSKSRALMVEIMNSFMENETKEFQASFQRVIEDHQDELFEIKSPRRKPLLTTREDDLN